MRARWQEADVPLLVCMLALMSVGATFLWSVSERPELIAAGGYEYRGTLTRQLGWALVGLLACLLSASQPAGRWSAWTFPLYIACTAACAAVLVVGLRVNDARRWFAVGGGVTVQPSEFMKVLLIPALARALMFQRGGGWGTLARVAAIAGIPAALVMLQPDMGTALLFVPVAGGMAFIAGVRGRLLGVAAAAAAIAAGAFLCLGLEAYKARAASLGPGESVWGLHAYQWRRIVSHVDPARHRSSGAFQAEQARIAIGSGRFLGKGIRNGTQSQLKLLPVRKSDFIFAVVAEEWGFLGCALVAAAYGGILLGCFAAAQAAAEPFRRLTAAGVGLLVGSEALLNMGVVTGLLPVTGTPLPLVSQGGSSLVATCMALGMVQSVRMWPAPDLGRGAR